MEKHTYSAEISYQIEWGREKDKMREKSFENLIYINVILNMNT